LSKSHADLKELCFIYASGLQIIHYAQNPPAVKKLSSFDVSSMLTSPLEYGRHDIKILGLGLMNNCKDRNESLGKGTSKHNCHVL